MDTRVFARRLIPLLLCLVVATLTAQEAAEGPETQPERPERLLSAIQFRLGQLWIGNAYRVDADGSPVQGSDVSPLKLTGGVATRLEFSSSVIFAPGLDFFWQQYLETETGKVVPTQIETGSYTGNIAGVLGIILSAPWLYEAEIGERTSLGFGAGPAFLIRLPLAPIEGSDVSGLTSYFYSGLRFLYPEVLGFLTYQVSQKTGAGLSLRGFLPLHNLWNQYSVPLWDELMIQLDLTLSVKLD